MKKTKKQKRFEDRQLYAMAYFDYSYQKNLFKKKEAARFKMSNFIKTVNHIKRSMASHELFRTGAMMSSGVCYDTRNKRFKITSSYN